MYSDLIKQRCCICNGTVKDEHKNERFTILKCNSCGHAFVGESLSESDLVQRYFKLAYWDGDRHHQKIYDMKPGKHWEVFINARMNMIKTMCDLPPNVNVNGHKTKIFEVGCSEGVVLNYLAELGYDVAGCEINPEIVAESLKHYSINIICADFLTHDFGDTRFDIIYSAHTFEHIPDLFTLTHKCYRLLTDGGALIIEVPFGPDEYNNLDHMHFFSHDSINILLSKFFKKVKLVENGYFNSKGIRCGSYYASGIK
ncbi:MAG: class I SAM-dependent methyltransferase [Nitrospirae bacterium]|nr:class I SAM-dependent methyltransferase [Nitrospirota bacterium]